MNIVCAGKSKRPSKISKVVAGIGKRAMFVVWIASIACCWCGGWLIWLLVAFIMADVIVMIDMIDVIKACYALGGSICSIVSDEPYVPVICKNTYHSNDLLGNGSSLYVFKPCRIGGIYLYSYFVPVKNVSGRELGCRTPAHRRTWRHPRHRRAHREAVPVRGHSVVRRPRRRMPPVDRSRLWKGRLSRAALPVAQVAGGRSLVRGGAAGRPARVDGDPPRAFAHLPRLSPQHRHHGQQGVPPAVRYRGGADRGLLRGARLDGVRHAQAEAAVRYPDHRAHHGRPVGNVVYPDVLPVGKRYFIRNAPRATLPNRVWRQFSRRPNAGL